jgi:signal transduction histidine kinase
VKCEASASAIMSMNVSECDGSVVIIRRRRGLVDGVVVVVHFVTTHRRHLASFKAIY